MEAGGQLMAAIVPRRSRVNVMKKRQDQLSTGTAAIFVLAAVSVTLLLLA